MSINANEDNDCVDDEGEIGSVATPYTDCGLDDTDDGVEMVACGGAGF